MGIFIKIGILHTLKFHLHTLSSHFWLNLSSRGQYPGCWCPGSLRRQDISSHGIDYVELGPGLTWERISGTCVISMWSNDIKCKYMFMFPLKNLARKELTHVSLLCSSCHIHTPNSNNYWNECNPRVQSSSASENAEFFFNKSTWTPV